MIDIAIHKKLDGAEGDMHLDLNFQVAKGEFITIYGPSGAGKTSLLRMIAGLMDPDKGVIKVNNIVWYDSNNKKNLSSQKRNLGVVFQDYALFPNMTVKENLEYAIPKSHSGSGVGAVMDMMEIKALQDRKPDTLSGGQKQRVAMARALVQKPEILLLDEPLSALDNKIRFKLQDYLQKAHKELSLTTILISHDIGEVIKLSDRVIVLDYGKITREGSPEEVFINNKLSGKFKFTGEVLKIEKQDVIYIVTVLIQNNVVKVVAQDNEVVDLNIGDKVMVASKAFNPIIYKI